MKLFPLSMLLLVACPLYAAPSVSGPWTITGNIQGYSLNETCNFTQDGSKLAGACQVEGQSVELTGAVEDNKITFTHGGEYQGDTVKVTYTATVAEDGTLSGTLQVQPYQTSGNFVGKRLDSKGK